jgi:hypothetical protein
MSADKPRAIRKAAKSLADQARTIAGNRDVLYHGTRYPSSILNSGIILRNAHGVRVISFTRSAEIAADFALLERDSDEGRGAILIFDRQSLRYRHRIEPFHEHQRDELEERTWDDLVDIGSHLVGLVTTPSICRSQKQRRLNRRHRLRLSELHGQMRNRVAGTSSNLAFARELAECQRIDREQQEKLRRLFPKWAAKRKPAH